MSLEEKFTVEVSNEHSLRRDSTVEHKEHGPMSVDSVRVGPSHKTMLLKSELGPEALELSGNEIRDAWGETIHVDPMELYSGETRVGTEGISIEGVDVEASMTVEGKPERAVELAYIHAKDEFVRALQAFETGAMPADCEGTDTSVNWVQFVENEERDER